MRSMTATEVARNLSRLLDSMEQGGEEVVVLRNKTPVAKLVPGSPEMNAIQALTDLHGILDDAEGARWLHDARRGKKRWVAERRDPWA